MRSTQNTQCHTLNPRLKDCDGCREQLVKKYKQDTKTVYCLDKTIKLTRNAFVCKNIICKKFDQKILHPRINPINHSIGYDLLLEIGQCRVNRKMTQMEIKDHLFAAYGISISDVHVGNLANLYLQLIGNKIHSTDLIKLRSRGNVIISIDGVKPQKANTSLYIIRDETSGKILLTKVLENSATTYIAELYEEIKSMKLPIIGIISDKQSSLRLAAEKVFPDIPHQYCQFHFISNISKDFNDRDRGLRKKTRKNFKGMYNVIKTMKKQLEKEILSENEYSLILELLRKLQKRSIVKAKYPFKHVGIELYNDLIIFRDEIKKLFTMKPERKIFKTILRHCDNALIENKGQYELCKTQLDHIIKITHLLKSDLIRKKAEFNFQKYIKNIRINPILNTWKIDIQKQSKSWLKGLFIKNEYSLIPRTNNAIEQYIKSLKADFVKILNRPFIHRIFLRKAEFWAFAREISEPKIGLMRLQNCNRTDQINAKSRFEKLAKNFRLERACAADFDKELKKTSQQLILMYSGG